MENGSGELRLRRLKRLAAQEEAAVSIDDSEGITVLAIQRLELALEVSGPDMIGGTHGGFRFTGMSAPRLRPSGGNKALSFEDVADSGTRGPGFMRLRSFEPGEQFLGAPGGMSVARLEDRLHQFGGGGVRAAGGFARSVHQACGPLLYIALHPLIAGGTADVVSEAELGEREEVVEVIGDESCTLVHG